MQSNKHKAQKNWSSTMSKCLSLTTFRNWYLRYYFSYFNLKSTSTDLTNGTTIHCWVPKNPNPKKLNLLLIHGMGANAMWQWSEFVKPLVTHFNLYLPDLVFFGGSHTTQPDRTESFQASCVMRAMDALGVRKMVVVGISYGGFVGYSMAAQFGVERVERLVLCCAGVCLEEQDMEGGLFQVKSVDEAVEVLLPLTAEKMRDLVKLSFHKPLKRLPDWFLNDFIREMCTEYREERKEIIQALHFERKLSDLPKITQPILLIWGEHDKIFPPELAHRLIRHLDEDVDVKLVVIKDAGHALNAEKPKELLEHLKAYLISPISADKSENNSNGNKKD